MALFTDDTARRNPFMWLGAAPTRWPVTARGSAWATAGAITAVAFAAVMVLTPSLLFMWVPLPATIPKFLLAVLVSPIVGVLTARSLYRHVTPTRSVKYLVAVAQAELDAPREPEPTVHRINPAGVVWAESDPAGTHTHTLTPTARVTHALTPPAGDAP